MNGILALWKPKGFTSHDCVMKIRRIYQTKKVGHTGTLDPEVEGVLPICIGQATKIVPFLTDTTKTYIAEVMIGISTETEDAHGEIVEEKALEQPLTEEMILEVLESFKGEITQIPPMYSAVKVNGRKLYEYARANQTVERPERKVQIYEIEKLENIDSPTNFKIKVVCGKGTYIRTLCVDIGKKLGYPAHMAELERTGTGSINQEDTVTFEQLEAMKDIDELTAQLLPITAGIDHLDCLFVDDDTKQRVQFGQKLPKPAQIMKTDPFAVMYGEKLLAIYQTHPEDETLIKSVRGFNDVL